MYACITVGMMKEWYNMAICMPFCFRFSNFYSVWMMLVYIHDFIVTSYFFYWKQRMPQSNLFFCLIFLLASRPFCLCIKVQSIMFSQFRESYIFFFYHTPSCAKCFWYFNQFFMWFHLIHYLIKVWTSWEGHFDFIWIWSKFVT